MIYRTEHPKPQFERKSWMNLNGQWDFEIDHGVSGVARKMYEPAYKLSGHIEVPFCPESVLSGVHHVDFMSSVWYKRTVELTQQQLSGRVILHFGAVDYRCTAWVNGKEVGSHVGGFCSFSFDITDALTVGVNEIALHAIDDVRDPMVPRGKQSELYHSHTCDYTRTTGIWQTVWLEFKPDTNIESVRYHTDIHGSVTIEAQLCGAATLEAVVTYEGREMARGSIVSGGGRDTLTLALAETHLWEVGHGRLYDVVLTYGSDTVTSYFGLRSLQLDGKKFLLNGKSVFQRLILDQGFYPDGIYTAPSDEALQKDIDMALAMGFNGARLHQKVFEERYLYHCDRKGYIVWGEYASWGIDHTDPKAVYSFLPQWIETVKRDINHPAIVGWCPYNETAQLHRDWQCNENIALTFDVTKAIDPTRPCIDTSGFYHVKTDIFDIHDYEQDPKIFAEHYSRMDSDHYIGVHWCFEDRQTYRGEPMFVSEYGGCVWNGSGNGWGYGNGPQTEQEFIDRFKGLTDVLLDHPSIFALCYTQLTDIEQEQNGLYTYDRKPKFDPAILHAIMSRKAAIED